MSECRIRCDVDALQWLGVFATNKAKSLQGLHGRRQWSHSRQINIQKLSIFFKLICVSYANEEVIGERTHTTVPDTARTDPHRVD